MYHLANTNTDLLKALQIDYFRVLLRSLRLLLGTIIQLSHAKSSMLCDNGFNRNKD